MQKIYAICAKNSGKNNDIDEKMLFLLCERKLE